MDYAAKGRLGDADDVRGRDAAAGVEYSLGRAGLWE